MIQSPLPPGKAFAIVNAQGKLAAPGERKHGYVCFDKGVAHCLHLATGQAFPLSSSQVRNIFAPTRPAARKKTVPPIIFSSLPAATDNLWCPRCHEIWRTLLIDTMTDEGVKKVGLCTHCEGLFRPWQPPEPAGETFRISRFGSNDDREIPSPLLKKPARKKTAKPRKPKVIVFSKLVRALSHQQECFYCNHETNDCRMMDTDEGRKRLVVCEECGEIMRPFAKKN
ncbi:MAG: hypothetical protein ABIH38_02875 [Patescibacteria group bacterium]